MKRHTQIICTLGPASCMPEIITGMIESGMDYARLNFSHGDAGDHRAYAEVVRKISRQVGREVKILQDLQGPKLRIGKLNHPIHFRARDRVILTDKATQSTEIPIAIPEILTWIKAKDRIFLDDGAVELEAIEVSGEQVSCTVRVGGRVDSGSGIQIQDHGLQLPTLSQKDLLDIEIGREMGVDLVAQSMVRSREDVDLLRGHLGSTIKIIAKIENVDALRDLERIVEGAWGIMVARGDLGVSVPRAQIPLWQREILETCMKRKRFGIVATEMLISMVKNDRPTRAEVSDVATAVFDGADAVMLSEETAIGAHPVKAVREMREIIETIEGSSRFRRRRGQSI